MREAALSYNRQAFSMTPRTAAESDPICGIKWESYCYLLLSCCRICNRTTNQSTEVKLPGSSRQYYLQMTKRLGKKPHEKFEHN